MKTYNKTTYILQLTDKQKTIILSILSDKLDNNAHEITLAMQSRLCDIEELISFEEMEELL